MTRVFSAIGISVLLSTVAAINPAMARSRCDGDFAMVGGSWIATRRCQEHEAEKVAREYHKRISDSPSSYNEQTPDEFCRGNNDIRVSTFCAAYKD
jgi:hypothetical protein